MSAIRFAIALPPTHVTREDYLAAAQAADALAFETFWGFDHLIPIVLVRRSPTMAVISTNVACQGRICADLVASSDRQASETPS